MRSQRPRGYAVLPENVQRRFPHGRMLFMAQDDRREQQMRDRLNLKTDRVRAGIDAYLEYKGTRVNFELKSTTGKSVSTARDFGPNHFQKWKDIHWIFAVYNREETQILKFHYASPAGMAPWIEEQVKYAYPDLVLLENLPDNAFSADAVLKIFDGNQGPYTRKDVSRIMKKQWTAEDYSSAADVGDLYSMEAVISMLHKRCRYLIERGSTRNNPHIPADFVAGLPLLDNDETAKSLRDHVDVYFTSKAAETDDATA